MDIQKRLADATEAMRRGALAEAECECRSILAIFPQQYRALVLLGQILTRAGRETEALAAYDRAAIADPSASVPFTYLAMKRFRNAFGAPVPPRPATVQNGHRVQMRALGRKGRFGNQLLQYAFVRLYAQQHDLVAEFPDWIGRDIFDFDDPFPSAKLPTFNEENADLFGSLQGRTGQVFADWDINGYFCGNTNGWGALRSQFCALFKPGQKVLGLLDQALDKLRSEGKTIVAIHLRKSDYGYGRFWVAPSSWYLVWLRTIWARLERPVLYIASDIAGPHPDFADFTPWSADQLGVEIPGANFLVDHHILRHADHLAISNSSFSFVAAMLNARALSFLRPDPNLRELIPFDPWASEVLRDAIVEPQAVAATERLFVQSQLLPADTVVHWGSYCSAWTNFARSVHNGMMIFEIEGEASVTDTLRKRGLRHVRLLVLEDRDILCKFSKNADDIFDHARVDMMLLRLNGEPGALVVSRQLFAAGYTVFRLGQNTLLRVTPYESNGRGSYLAVRQDLAPPFQSRASRLCFSARNLLRRFFRWMLRTANKWETRCAPFPACEARRAKQDKHRASRQPPPSRLGKGHPVYDVIRDP
jgi:hypothetical protein